jgi:chromosome segregation ATPase
VAGLEQLRKQKDSISEHIALLQEERTELAAKKKTLDAPQAQKLTELEVQLAALQPLPQYLSTYARFPLPNCAASSDLTSHSCLQCR